jgi:hypothetical protein
MTSRRTTTTTVVTVALIAELTGIASAQPVALRYKWTTGDEARYRVTQQPTGTVSGPPNGLAGSNIEMTIVQVARSAVKDVSTDGTATMEQIYESIRFDINSPVATAFDSANRAADANPMDAALAAMVGESFVIVVSPTGVVQKVEGFEMPCSPGVVTHTSLVGAT